MGTRPHRWLERLTVEVSDANRRPVGEACEVRGCLGTKKCGKCWKILWQGVVEDIGKLIIK